MPYVRIEVSRFTCPDRISIGIESVHAPNTPFSALMLPGPEVTFSSPGVFVIRA